MVKSIHMLDISHLDHLRHIVSNAWEYLPGSVHLDPHGAFWEGWVRGQAHRRALEVYWSLSHPIIKTLPVKYAATEKHTSHQSVHSRPRLCTTLLTPFETKPLQACSRDASGSRVYGCMESMQG